jgi:hypothetical protein
MAAKILSEIIGSFSQRLRFFGAYLRLEPWFFGGRAETLNSFAAGFDISENFFARGKQ